MSMYRIPEKLIILVKAVYVNNFKFAVLEECEETEGSKSNQE